MQYCNLLSWFNTIQIISKDSRWTFKLTLTDFTWIKCHAAQCSSLKIHSAWFATQQLLEFKPVQQTDITPKFKISRGICSFSICIAKLSKAVLRANLLLFVLSCNLIIIPYTIFLVRRLLSHISEFVTVLKSKPSCCLLLIQNIKAFSFIMKCDACWSDRAPFLH